MRVSLFVGSAALAISLLSGSVAFAQAQNNTDISGPLGAMTCSDFTQLSPTAQADQLKQVGETNPAGSLTSNSSTTTTANGAVNVSGSTTGTPLTAGELIAACQGSSPSLTVHDAFSKFNSSNSMSTTTTKK